MKYQISIEKILKSGLTISIKDSEGISIKKDDKKFSKLMKDLKDKLDKNKQRIWFTDLQGEEVKKVVSSIDNANKNIIEI